MLFFSFYIVGARNKKQALLPQWECSGQHAPTASQAVLHAAGLLTAAPPSPHMHPVQRLPAHATCCMLLHLHPALHHMRWLGPWPGMPPAPVGCAPQWCAGAGKRQDQLPCVFVRDRKGIREVVVRASDSCMCLTKGDRHVVCLCRGWDGSKPSYANFESG